MHLTSHSITRTLAAAALVATTAFAIAPTAGAATTAAAPPECTNAELTASYAGGQGAAGHVLGRIVLRNTSDQSCWVQGYGGLFYVGGSHGRQVGAAADRTKSPTPRTLVAPGERVRSQVDETSTGPYSDQQCHPRKVAGFRVYLPDETRSQFVAHPTTGCADTDVHLLSHQAYR